MKKQDVTNLKEGQIVFVKQGWFPWTFKGIVHDTSGNVLLELERIPDELYPDIYMNQKKAYFSPRFVSETGKEILK